MSRLSSWYHQNFFNFRFSSRRSQSQQKLAKKIAHFTIKLCSKKLQSFYKGQLTWHWKWYASSIQPISFLKFSESMFLFGVRKNVCTAPFLDAQELHSWSTLKANVCMFLYISLRKFFFQRRSKVVSVKGWDESE